MARQASANLPLFTDEEVEERRHILLDGIQQFNEGYFFEAHEVWEGLWLQCPWPTRRFLQGLIQVAAALVHFVRHEYPGTVRLLEHAQEKLADFTPRYMGIDVAALVAEVEDVRQEVTSLGPERFEELAANRIPRIAFASESGVGAEV